MNAKTVAPPEATGRTLDHPAIACLDADHVLAPSAVPTDAWEFIEDLHRRAEAPLETGYLGPCWRNFGINE